MNTTVTSGTLIVDYEANLGCDIDWLLVEAVMWVVASEEATRG